MKYIILLYIIAMLWYILTSAYGKNVYKQRRTIIDAIYYYHIVCTLSHSEFEVHYYDMESYTATSMRIWDWGHTRILPKEKFEIIKPYIGAHLPSCFGSIISGNAVLENECFECPFERECDIKRKENAT